jgi:hypothetical protein
MKKGPIIEYFRDGPTFVAAFDKGQNGFFIFREKSTAWEFVTPGSEFWDALLQDAYHKNHDYSPCDKSACANLPPLPPLPEFKCIRWADNFKIKSPLFTDRYPTLTAYLKTQPDSGANLYFLLSEDLYETYYGDGKFLYFSERIFLSEKTALTQMTELNRLSEIRREEKHEWGDVYHLKTFNIRINNNELVVTNHEPRLFEHYYVEEILDLYEKSLIEYNKNQPIQ